MNTLQRRCLSLGAAGMLLLPAASSQAQDTDQGLIARGRYIVTISGCNDCHTAGYGLGEGHVAETQWLTGDKLGWYGPWGTTYATNLRLLVDRMSETQWVEMARTLKARPPMPWFNLNKMSTEDTTAVYHYLRFLGPAGEPAPVYQPPGVEPTPPYVAFPTAGP